MYHCQNLRLRDASKKANHTVCRARWRECYGAGSGTGSLVFIDDVAVKSSSKMSSEVYRTRLSLLTFSQITQNSFFTVQMDNKAKHTAAPDFLKAKKWESQLPDLNLNQTELTFQLPKPNTSPQTSSN